MSKPTRYKLSTRPIVLDLGGYDGSFQRQCEEIFQINAYLDREEGKLLREWVKTAVRDIVGFYSINPSTLAGSIQEGPYIPGYAGMDQQTPEQIERFERLYQVFATHVFAALHEQLRHVVDQVIDRGFADIVCNIFDYQLGMLVLEVEAVGGMGDSEEAPSNMLDRARRNTNY